jgi:hypothetical protein
MVASLYVVGEEMDPACVVRITSASLISNSFFVLHRQILLAALVVLVALSTTTSAFTPDAAFKMKTLVGTTQPSNNDAGKRGIVVTPSSQSTRNMQLSLIGQAEYIRKSITVPPAYEDYMAVRQRSLLGLLNLQRDD